MSVGIPQHIKFSLDEYAKSGRPTGGFLRAVLENDLMKAAGKADEFSRIAFFDICSYIYNKMPLSCYGSPEKVEAWLQEGQKQFAKLLVDSSKKEE